MRKVQTVSCTVSNRVFYKELEEGACKIVDGNMILLAQGTRTVPHSKARSTYLNRKLLKCCKSSVSGPDVPKPRDPGVRTEVPMSRPSGIMGPS